MDGPRDCHTKQSKLNRERQILHDITYMWNVKKWYKWTYLCNGNRVTDVENRLMIISGERWGRDKLGEERHIYITIYKIDN